MKFRPSRPLSLGVELELQLVDPCTGQLSDRATELVGSVEGLTTEITQAMVEYNSPVCSTAPQLEQVLLEARGTITGAAAQIGLDVCGGGLHPFHRWPERQVSTGERFDAIHTRYAYLAKMFTVFGLHVHVGCPNGHDALYLVHALSRYMPHFIALTAASPFYRGVDTQFDCARLNVLTAFPTSGTAAWIHDWDEFREYVLRLQELGVVESMKDFYWDVRPKPDTGTVEIRVCDTPLTVGEAADLAAYAQLLCCEALNDRSQTSSEDMYLPYRTNRFEACRYGFEGIVTDPLTGARDSIRTEILRTLERLWPLAQELDCERALTRLAERTEHRLNGARWLRGLHTDGATLAQVVAAQAAAWAGRYALADTAG